MSNFRGWEWIIILLLALLLFGGFKKLPDAARGIGRSLRIFKAETKGLVDDEKGDGGNPDESPSTLSGTPEVTTTQTAPAPTGSTETKDPQPAAAPQAPGDSNRPGTSS
ncbi:MAG: Sec-independent protein translocase subunit TatA [Candidatus Nanopelagicales bacterium]|nr:Sec-independent protein translocase subunit TatA [Candidatus Nanopelagicales bacterium]